MQTAEVDTVEPKASRCGVGCTCAVGTPARPDTQARRWAWWMTSATIGWNSLEAVIAMVGGILAGSIALVSFGLDSGVEVASAVIIGWRLPQRTADHIAQERAEQRAVRLIALSFLRH